MKFYQLKISDRYYPKRLNRVIAVREDLNLNDIGIIIARSFGAAMEHFFMFADEEKVFVPQSLSDQFSFLSKQQTDLKKANLKNIDRNFVYTYDTGESYDFNCTVLTKKTDIEEEGLVARTLKATGLGIFEDNHICLEDYFEGQLNPDSTRGLEEYQILPWNLAMQKFSDFEKEINPEDLDMYEEELYGFREDLEDHARYGYGDNESEEAGDDGQIDPYIRENFLRQEVASDIFEDIDINAKYRQLILKHDINEAYEMIVKCMIEADRKGEEDDLDDEETDKLYYEAVEDLD